MDDRLPELLHVAVLPTSAPTFGRLSALLAATPGFEVVEDSESADVVVVVADDGAVVHADPGLPTVTIGGARPATAAFASGQLGRNPTAAELEAAIRAVAAGLVVYEPAAARSLGPDGGVATLTTREREVLALMAEGLPNKGIALRLGISEHTAKFHVGAVLAKLDAESRAEAVVEGARRGILTL